MSPTMNMYQFFCASFMSIWTYFTGYFNRMVDNKCKLTLVKYIFTFLPSGYEYNFFSLLMTKLKIAPNEVIFLLYFCNLSLLLTILYIHKNSERIHYFKPALFRCLNPLILYYAAIGNIGITPDQTMVNAEFYHRLRL